MRLYAIAAGVVFGLITLVHLWRIAVEPEVVVSDPWFVLLTLAAAALSFMAWRVTRRPAA
jgi:hypothetical protein